MTDTQKFITEYETDNYLNSRFIVWYKGKNLTIIADETEDGKRILQLVRLITNSHNTARIKQNINNCCDGFLDE